MTIRITAVLPDDNEGDDDGLGSPAGLG